MDKFEENLGKYPYVTLAQVKEYLSIASNTHDERLESIIIYTTAAIENHIGQQVLANNYQESFDGGTSTIYVKRLPLTEVFQVTEFDGQQYQVLNDPMEDGSSVPVSKGSLSLTLSSNVSYNNKIKKFGLSSVKFEGNGLITSSTIPVNMRFEESDFTIEAFIRVSEPNLIESNIFSMITDESNYLTFGTSELSGLFFESSIDGNVEFREGANTDISSQVYEKRKWAHVAVSRNLEEERLYLFYNGELISNTAYDIEDLSFSNKIEIGNSFTGYLDELRVSNTCRYKTNFSIPTNRFRPEKSTILLLHFDGNLGDKQVYDSQSVSNDFVFSRRTGRITKDLHNYSRSSTYPSMSLSGPPKFSPTPNGVTVHYRAGYELGDVPKDLELVTIDYVKMLYKQDQDRRGFSLEGERVDRYNMTGNLPAHIRRILDLYRIL